MNSRNRDTIQLLYSQITALESYAPSKEINELFTKLVYLALNPESTNTLTQTQNHTLQQICSLAEYELEKYWAKNIITSRSPLDALEKFPYIENYHKLTQMEWYSLLSCTNHTYHHLLFVGGGPLPLTAIILAKNYGQKVTVIDVDSQACQLSQKLVNKLQLADKITIINADGAMFAEYVNFNVITVAALAGVDQDSKQNILLQIKNLAPKNAHVVARSSWGMREILYRPLSKEFYQIFQPVIEVRPHNDVVNSVVIFANS